MRPWSLLTILDFSARGRKTQRYFNFYSPSSAETMRLVFSRVFFLFAETSEMPKEKQTRKTCFSRELGFTHLPCKILLGGISLMSSKSLLYFHEKDMKTGDAM